MFVVCVVAEGMGFEPMRVLRPYSLSRGAQ